MSEKQAQCHVCTGTFIEGYYRTHVDEAHPGQMSGPFQKASAARRRRWTHREVELLRRRVMAGETPAAIATEYNLTESRVRQIFVEHDIKIGHPDSVDRVSRTEHLRRVRSASLQARRQLVEKYGDQWGEVVRLREKGRTLPSIASDVR